MEQTALSMKEQLILAGLEEINTYGLPNFSTRRVAKACGVSCAAPYKHFKDTAEFISEIMNYINQEYTAQLHEVIEKYRPEGYRAQLVQIGLYYVRFLTENPDFRSLIMMNYTDTDERNRVLRGKLSPETYRIISLYCREANMPPETRKRKIYVFRSLIYCAAMFFANGEMVYNDENIKMVEAMLSREFDLP